MLPGSSVLRTSRVRRNPHSAGDVPWPPQVVFAPMAVVQDVRPGVVTMLDLSGSTPVNNEKDSL